MHCQDDQPDPDDKAFLSQEESIAQFKHIRHERIGFGSASLDPLQGKEGVHEIENQDQHQQREVPARETIDECIAGFACAASTLFGGWGPKSPRHAEVGRARRSGPRCAIGRGEVFPCELDSKMGPLALLSSDSMARKILPRGVLLSWFRPGTPQGLSAG